SEDDERAIGRALRQGLRRREGDRAAHARPYDHGALTPAERYSQEVVDVGDLASDPGLEAAAGWSGEGAAGAPLPCSTPSRGSDGLVGIDVVEALLERREPRLHARAATGAAPLQAQHREHEERAHEEHGEQGDARHPTAELDPAGLVGEIAEDRRQL